MALIVQLTHSSAGPMVDGPSNCAAVLYKVMDLSSGTTTHIFSFSSTWHLNGQFVCFFSAKKMLSRRCLSWCRTPSGEAPHKDHHAQHLREVAAAPDCCSKRSNAPKNNHTSILKLGLLIVEDVHDQVVHNRRSVVEV